MTRTRWFVVVVLALGALGLGPLSGCSDAAGTGSSESEIGARTNGRRAQLARLQRVDALARLYVGHELRRDELLALGSKNESIVIAELVARPDFKTRFSGRLAELDAVNGKPNASTSRNVDPSAPLSDAFGGTAEKKKADATRFARWLARELAPRVADDLIAKHDGAFAQMTYKELLDTIRTFSADAARVRRTG